MKGGDFIAKLAAKSGINLADEKNKDLARAIALITNELPDEAVTKMSGALMNIDDARNNIDLKKHFTAAVLDGVDVEINKAMEELGFEVADKEAIKATETSFKKIGALSKKIAELEKQKAGASGKDKSDLQVKINELTTQLASLPKQHAEEIKSINSQWEQKFTTTQIRSMLNGKKYANDQVPLDVNVETALVLLNRELEKSGAKYVNVNGQLVLRQLADDKLDWINPSNEKPTFEQFLDGVLASNKLIAVQQAAAAGQNGAGTYVPPANISGNGNGNANPSVLASMQEDLRALEAMPN